MILFRLPTREREASQKSCRDKWMDCVEAYGVYDKQPRRKYSRSDMKRGKTRGGRVLSTLQRMLFSPTRFTKGRKANATDKRRTKYGRNTIMQIFLGLIIPKGNPRRKRKTK